VSKCGIGDPIGNQAQSLEASCGAPCQEWSRAGHGGMLGTRSGRIPGDSVEVNCFATNFFARFFGRVVGGCQSDIFRKFMHQRKLAGLKAIRASNSQKVIGGKCRDLKFLETCGLPIFVRCPLLLYHFSMYGRMSSSLVKHVRG
jgi:hypothetical protein